MHKVPLPNAVWLYSIGLASIQADMLTQHHTQYWQRPETFALNDYS